MFLRDKLQKMSSSTRLGTFCAQTIQGCKFGLWFPWTIQVRTTYTFSCVTCVTEQRRALATLRLVRTVTQWTLIGVLSNQPTLPKTDLEHSKRLGIHRLV